MSRDTELDIINVIDIEATFAAEQWNERAEICEIGIVEYSTKTGHSERWQSIRVMPTRGDIDKRCTELTGWTPEDFTPSQTVSFRDACKLLRTEFQSRQRVFASWGDYDRRQFERQCTVEAVPYPFNITHLNIKNLFALKFRLEKEVEMPEALQILKMPLLGIHHRGLDDAINTALILAHLI